jgi:hypothetical protein
MIEIFSTIIDSKVGGVDSLDFDYQLMSKYKSVLFDNSYFDFIIESGNGGFFFQQSLCIYGFYSKKIFNSIEYINKLVEREYGNISKGLIVFAQDIFGNQFAFNQNIEKIVFFNIETGEQEAVASSFIEWISVLLNDLEYFTGLNLVVSWKKKNSLAFDERLCAKKPFVIGGEYSLNNLYASKFPDYLVANANIAWQVYNLPDGTDIKLKIIE